MWIVFAIIKEGETLASEMCEIWRDEDTKKRRMETISDRYNFTYLVMSF